MIDPKLTNEIKWIFNIKEKIPQFLKQISGRKKRGFYSYSLSGDLFGERIKWGLGNNVFFLKIIYTLGLQLQFKNELRDDINYILSFQKKDGSIYDPLISILSLPLRILHTLKSGRLGDLSNKKYKRAETRQSVSSLSLFGVKTSYEYKKISRNYNGIKNFLIKLNWELPWGAGSHFSHLLFFLYHSSIKNKDDLINYAITWVNKLQHKDDGFWYLGNPSIQEKINGAMKIITGLKAVNRVFFKYPEKIIDQLLLAKNDEQACDNFNVVYVLKYCNELTKFNYRSSEIQDYFYERLKIYHEYYYPEFGGFSFKKKKANDIYYGAFISRGKREPDIHGTVLFLWGISIIAQTLNINEKLKFNEFVA